MPGVDGQLTGDQGGADLGPVLDDLQEIAALLDCGRAEEKIVKHEQGDALELSEQAGIAAVAASDGEIVEEPRGAHVEGGVALADGGVGERA
jgi:hypothetical protein